MGAEKELNTDVVLEDGMYLRNAQLGATDKIIRISKSSLLQNDADYFDSILTEFAIVKRIMRKYPSSETPKTVYKNLQETAESNLPKSLYGLLTDNVEKL
jgi:iron uptake system EfeUOB component EfeO/EfeM